MYASTVSRHFTSDRILIVDSANARFSCLGLGCCFKIAKATYINTTIGVEY